MKIPIFRFKICHSVKFDALTIPCVWFLLGLTVAVASMIVGSTEWIYVMTTAVNSTAVNSTAVNSTAANGVGAYEYRTGLFKQCVGTSCNQIDFNTIGPMGHRGCYGSLQGIYSATCAFIFVGIGFGVLGVWMTWRIWKGVLRNKPKRQKRNRRRSWWCCLSSAVAYFIAFIIFIATTGTNGNCGVKYCDGSYCATGAPPWFCLGISIMTLWATYIMYYYKVKFPLTLTEVVTELHAFELSETTARGTVLSEEDAEFTAVCRMAYNDVAQKKGYVMSITRGMIPASQAGTAIPPPPANAVGSTLPAIPPSALPPATIAPPPATSETQQQQQQQQMMLDKAYQQVFQQQQQQQGSKQEQAAAVTGTVMVPTATVASTVTSNAAATSHQTTLRPTIGVEIQMMDDAMGNRENIVMVHSLVAGGASEAAGVLPGDILVKWDGRALNSKQAFAECLKHATIDSEVVLTILRNNATIQRTVRVKGTLRKSAQAK